MNLDQEFELIVTKHRGRADRKSFYEETRKIEELVKENTNLLSPENQFDLYYENGYYFYDIEKNDDALVYFEKAWECTKYMNQNALRYTNINDVKLNVKSALGHTYLANGNNDKALENFKECLFWATISDTKGNHPLYSYREVNKYLLQDIINKEITVVNPKLFNDPLDCPILSIIKKTFENIEEARDTREILEKAYSYFKIKSFVSYVGVKDNSRPFSKGIDSTEHEKEYCNFLMWSHYANEHKGICIKYRISTKFLETNVEKNISSTIYNVDYEKDLIPSKEPVKTFRQAVATKNICWKYENEVRLIHYDPNCSADFKSLPLGKHASIEAIYFGLRCPAKDIDTIKAILGDDVAYFKMKVDDEDLFKLVEIPLNDKAKAMVEAASEMVAEIVESPMPHNLEQDAQLE